LNIVKMNRKRHAIENWMSKGLLISRLNKLKLYKKFVNHPSPFNKNIFTTFRHLYNKTVKAAKKLFFEKQFNKFQSNLKKSWQLLYASIDKKIPDRDTVGTINVDGVLYRDPLSIAEKFNEFFTSIAHTISEKIVPTDHPPDVAGPDPFPDPDRNNVNYDGPIFKFSDSPVTCSEIIEVIQSLEPKKSIDVNGLSMFFVSKFALTLSVPLKHIISTSFNSGIFPEQLKQAKVIPVFKSGDRSNMNNYRHFLNLIILFRILSLAFEGSTLQCIHSLNF
jgi:hypothetical protein